MPSYDGLPSKRSASSKSVSDWIDAGYVILASEGIKALKIDRLCRHLGVTKGSFYWHFDGMPSYRAALIATWGELRDAERRTFDDLGHLEPRERLAHMMSALVSPRHWTLERAMREWARTDESVAASVRTSDKRVLGAVRRAFVDYGFDAEDAELRANVVFATGIGFLHLSEPGPGERDAARSERFLELVLAR